MRAPRFVKIIRLQFAAGLLAGSCFAAASNLVETTVTEDLACTDRADAIRETLVNTFSILSPFSPIEKQALLEAGDLKTRADMLVALTEMALGAERGGIGTQLQ